MPKKTINAKEILTDLKAGMDNTALMEKYGLSEKGLQSLFKKLTDAGVLKNYQWDEQRISLQRNTGDPANHKAHLEPMEALSAVSQGQLQICAENA
jgi:hypothetical protein